MKILVVEDDLVTGGALRILLSDAGHEVRWCATIRLALDELAFKTLPDVIVLDWCLPDGGGDALLVALDQAGVKIPVVGVTALDTAGVAEVHGLRPDLKILRKPFTPEELKEALLEIVPTEVSKPC